MVIIKNTKETVQITDHDFQIIMDAILHELQRYNKCLDLCPDTVRKAIENERNKVYLFYSELCKLLVNNTGV